MSIVNTETLQADKLVAKDGTETTQVDIPSINKKVCFAKCLLRTPDKYGPIYFSQDSFNVSSITQKATTVWTVTLIHEKPITPVIYGVSVNGHDRRLGQFLDAFHYHDADTRNSIELHFAVWQNPTANPNLISTDIIVF